MLMESKTKPSQFRCLVQASIREARCKVDHWSDIAELFLRFYRCFAVREPGADLGK